MAKVLVTVQPRLRATATVEIDATAPLPQVAQQLEYLTGVVDPGRVESPVSPTRLALSREVNNASLLNRSVNYKYIYGAKL